MTRERQIRYRCTDCGHEFSAGPGPVRGGARHALPGTGHPASVDGACPACGSLYVGRLAWYALVTQVKAEAAVRDRLKAAGYRALWLHYLVEVKRSNRTTASRRHTREAEPAKVRRAVLPAGYVFARLVPGEIAAARDLPGVVGFCGTEAGAGPIPDGEMEAFVAWGDADGCVALESPADARRRRFEPGDWVRVLAGSFEGLEYPVVFDEGKELVEVMSSLFGRQTGLKLPYWQIELVAKAA